MLKTSGQKYLTYWAYNINFIHLNYPKKDRADKPQKC